MRVPDRVVREYNEAEESFGNWFRFAENRKNPKPARLTAAYHAMIDATRMVALIEVFGEAAFDEGDAWRAHRRFRLLWGLIHGDLGCPDVPYPYQPPE